MRYKALLSGAVLFHRTSFQTTLDTPLPLPQESGLLKKKKSLSDPSQTVGGSTNWHSHYGERYGVSLKNQEIKLP